MSINENRSLNSAVEGRRSYPFGYIGRGHYGPFLSSVILDLVNFVGLSGVQYNEFPSAAEKVEAVDVFNFSYCTCGSSAICADLCYTRLNFLHIDVLQVLLE